MTVILENRDGINRAWHAWGGEQGERRELRHRCLQYRKIEILFTDGATVCSLFIFLSELESHVVQAGLKLRMILNF